MTDEPLIQVRFTDPVGRALQHVLEGLPGWLVGRIIYRLPYRGTLEVMASNDGGRTWREATVADLEAANAWLT